MTRTEYNKLKELKQNISYTQAEIDFLLEVTKANVNPHQRVCASCSSSVSELKQTLYGWFNSAEASLIQEIEEAEAQAQLTELEKVEKQVTNYTGTDTSTKQD